VTHEVLEMSALCEGRPSACPHITFENLIREFGCSRYWVASLSC
jgi:hypothetical protein